MKINRDDIFRSFKTYIVAILAFFISAGMLLIFQNDKGGKTFFMLSALTASYYAYCNINNQSWKKISRGILIGLATVMFLFLVIETFKAATTKKQWDFMAFYMQGQLGLNNLDFYDPNSFTILMKNGDFNYDFSVAFKEQILNVGFLSPPITMLFFAPLASLDAQTSRLIISILTLILIVIDAILLNKIFSPRKNSIYSFLFIFIITMLLPATNATIGANQTTFFILFFLTLVLYKIDKPIAGLYLALSLIIKPITGILILYFIFNKKWKSVLYFFATGAGLLLLTGFIWGFYNIIDFFRSPPTKRLPQYLYESDNNFSLIAVLNRDIKDLGLSHNMVNLIFIFGACLLMAVTYYLSKRLIKLNYYLAFSPFILCMLMIYPSSLECYMVLIIPSIVYLLIYNRYNNYFYLILLIAFSFLRIEGFFTYLILLLIFLYIGFLNKKTNNFQNIRIVLGSK